MRSTFFVLCFAATAVLQAADLANGKAVYDKTCKSCHGADGAPNAAISKMMKVDMRDLKSPEAQAASDDTLKKDITDGVGKMKAVPAAAPAAADVVAYMRALKK